MDSFQLYFAKAIQVIKLNKLVIHEMARDEKAFKPALLILVLPNLINFALAALAYRIFPLDFLVFVIGLILVDIFMLLAASFLASNIFKGKKQNRSFFTVAALSNVLSWILIMPFVLALIGLPAGGIIGMAFLFFGIWKLVVIYNIFKLLYAFSTFKCFLNIVIFIIMDAAIKGFLVENFFGKDYKEILENGFL